MQLGIIADDITGSSAMAGTFDRDLDVNIYLNNQIKGNPDIAFIDTNSRFDSYSQAYKKVYEATKNLLDKQPEILLNKICSTFRGNIGAELDAFLDATDESFILIVAGYPDNGRTTIEGIHYVNGIKLENSSLSKDPVNPMVESDLVKILQQQTKRKVGLLDFSVLDLPLKDINKFIKKQSTEVDYLICDCRNNNDLITISKIIENHNIVASSIGLGKYLKIKTNSNKTNYIINNNLYNRSIIVSGSLTPTTKLQVQHAIDQGVLGIKVDPVEYIINKKDYRHISNQVIEIIKNDTPVMLYTSNNDWEVESFKRQAKDLGLDDSTIAKEVSKILSAIVKQVDKEIYINKLIIGGGDTSEAVLRELDIYALKSYQEIEKGVSSNYTIDGLDRLVVLKSGNFGSKEFYINCIGI